MRRRSHPRPFLPDNVSSPNCIPDHFVKTGQTLDFRSHPSLLICKRGTLGVLNPEVWGDIQSLAALSPAFPSPFSAACPVFISGPLMLGAGKFQRGIPSTSKDSALMVDSPGTHPAAPPQSPPCPPAVEVSLFSDCDCRHG